MRCVVDVKVSSFYAEVYQGQILLRSWGAVKTPSEVLERISSGTNASKLSELAFS
jgi:hypothetical protein